MMPNFEDCSPEDLVWAQRVTSRVRLAVIPRIGHDRHVRAVSAFRPLFRRARYRPKLCGNAVAASGKWTTEALWAATFVRRANRVHGASGRVLEATVLSGGAKGDCDWPCIAFISILTPSRAIIRLML
jgi:hypothetical protein